ncbi:MAG: alpha/beta fold hydrolase, partial [Planctomycetota bacterium]
MNILTVEYPDTSTFSEPWRLPCGPRFVRGWIPQSAPRCAIVIVHGLGDHSGRFEAPANWLRDRGAAVYALDQIGHGQSPGKRMCIPSYVSLLDDLEHVLAEVHYRHPDVPKGIFGQSMGGNIALNYSMRG